MKIKTTTSIPWRYSLKKTILLLTMVLGAAFVWQAKAQSGSTCTDPMMITNMPFTHTANTSTYGNDYTSTDVPDTAPGAVTTGTGNTSYLLGFEAVYSYTAGADGSISINTTNDDGWAGLCVFNGCPFDSTVGYHTSTSGGTRSISDLPVTAGETYYIVVSNWDPPGMDYTLNITGTDVLELEPCTGTPDAGTAVVNPQTGNAWSSYTVSAQNYTLASEMSFQWQSNTNDQGWEDEGDVTETHTPYTATAPDEIGDQVEWRLVLTCTESEETSISDTATFTTELTYCIPTGPSNNSDEIRNFTLSNLDNDSAASEGTSGYSDYTETVPPAEIHIGESYVASLTSGTGSGNHGAAIWIDLNDNGTFESDEMVAHLSNISASSTVEFPAFVASDHPGLHRLRVQYVYNQSGDNLDPCNTSTGFSEVEDYLVEYITLEDCEGMPTAGTPDEDELEVCANMPFTVSVSDASEAANNLYRRWQSSPAGEDDCTDIPESVTSSFVVQDGVDEPTDFRYVLTCDEEDTDISDIIEVTLKPANECYCIPGGTNSSYYINNFSTSGGEENIENFNSGFSENGYGDFTETHIVSQAHTLSIDFEADYLGGTFGTKIWVDWNQDGIFDEDEIVYQTSSYSSSESGSFEVPESAELGETRMRIGISYTPSSGPNDPCESGSREFEDYTFEVLALEDCEGTPTAGTVDPEMNVCAGMPFTLSSEGATAAANGLDRIWQLSPAGEDDWTYSEDSNPPHFILEDGITGPTDFRYSVNCTLSGESDISGVIEVTLKPATECYCTPLNTSSTTSYITKVETVGASGTDLNKSSQFSEDGYADYTETDTLVVFPGDEIDLTTTYQGGTSYVEVWIDWDKTGNFDGANDHVISSGSYTASPYTGTFEIPEDITEGLITRLRVRAQYLGGSPGPCTESGYGETEDYTIEIIPLEDCEGPVSAGTIADDIEICAGIAFNVLTTGASDPANGQIRIWQSSPAGEDDWADIEGAHSNNYNISEGVFEDTDFRYTVVCNNDDATDISDILSVTLKPGNECYCTPIYSTGCTSNDRISNVTLVGESEIIDNDSGCSPNAYGDYTDLTPADLAPGETYTLLVTSDYSSPTFEDVRVWIDYNNNGNFEDSEEIANTNGNGLPSNGTGEFDFTVLETAEPGNYRMRVRLVYSSSNIDPCDSATYGETEDYTVEVIELEDCEGPVTAGTIEDDFDVCAGNSFTVSVSDASDPANGLVRQWQSSPAGEDDWADIEGAHSNTYNVSEGIEEPTDYRYTVTCENDDETDTSDILTVGLNPAIECYCTPLNTGSTTSYITKVETQGASGTDLNKSSQFSENG